MDKNKTEIVLVVDKSGSMHCLQDTVITSINGFLKDQKDCEGSASVTMYSFNDEVQVMQECCDIQKVPELTRKNYEPDGCTALLDAVGRAIDETGARLAATAEEQRPGTVIMGIMTDGLENSSRKYAWKDIAERIARQKEKYSWKFMFFGAGEDAIKTAADMNIAREDSVAWEAGDKDEVRSFVRAQGRRVKCCRKMAVGFKDKEVMQTASCSLSDLMDEERRNIKKEKKGKK